MYTYKCYIEITSAYGKYGTSTDQSLLHSVLLVTNLSSLHRLPGLAILFLLGK